MQEVWIQYLVREDSTFAFQPKNQNIKQKQYKINEGFKHGPHQKKKKYF